MRISDFVGSVPAYKTMSRNGFNNLMFALLKSNDRKSTQSCIRNISSSVFLQSGHSFNVLLNAQNSSNRRGLAHHGEEVDVFFVYSRSDKNPGLMFASLPIVGKKRHRRIINSQDYFPSPASHALGVASGVTLLDLKYVKHFASHFALVCYIEMIAEKFLFILKVSTEVEVGVLGGTLESS